MRRPFEKWMLEGIMKIEKENPDRKKADKIARTIEDKFRFPVDKEKYKKALFTDLKSISRKEVGDELLVKWLKMHEFHMSMALADGTIKEQELNKFFDEHIFSEHMPRDRLRLWAGSLGRIKGQANRFKR